MQHSFTELGVSARIVRALAERDIIAPFPIQAKVLRDALAGRDVLAKAPTGSGKTIAFAIPIVERIDAGAKRPAAVVLVPTRELALQVTGEFEALAPRGVEIATVYGGVPLHAQAKRARAAHVLVATPGRLNDLLERKAVTLDGVTILVLDEADRMLDMGFKPQVDRIVRRMPGSRQTMFFSATLDAAVGEVAHAYTSNAVRYEAAPIAPEHQVEVEHRFVPVKPDDKVETLAELLRDDERGLALVFVRTRRGADRLVKKLAFHQIDAIALHGDLNQSQRERALRKFESGKASTLVATDVAARGLDLADITHVINFDPPAEHSGYVHRVGRTGRAGRGGVGVTLVLPDQQADVSRVARLAGHTEQFASGGMAMAPARRVYSSRRGRSKWGSPAPRRKI
ncbi:MAG TPA: DEAD/DEAH box helicase [Gaiellaceae bacterium]|jgi:ATP-dependent RNA helicase RhlE|nr:DEAD/DEAH box helicase [Gaiellaceae bacterium]